MNDVSRSDLHLQISSDCFEYPRIYCGMVIVPQRMEVPAKTVMNDYALGIAKKEDIIGLIKSRYEMCQYG